MNKASGSTTVKCFFFFSFLLSFFFGMAISPTGGVFAHLPHHLLDLASEDSVGHST